MYSTDSGIEELAERRGMEEVTLAYLADRLSTFVDEHPEFDDAINRFATWIAREEDDAT